MGSWSRILWMALFHCDICTTNVIRMDCTWDCVWTITCVVFKLVCMFLMEAPLWERIPTCNCGDKKQPQCCKIFHCTIYLLGLQDYHYYTCTDQMSHLLRLPDLQHWHTSNNGVGIFLSSGVHCIIGTNHQNQVGLWLDTKRYSIIKHFFPIIPWELYCNLSNLPCLWI